MLLNLENICKKYGIQINGVIHVGAHFGEESSTYKKLNINNIIYFEPVKKTFKTLKENCINGEELYNIALGNHDGFIEMYVEDLDSFGCHSILKPSDNYKNISFSTKELVEIKKLDSLAIDFSKYDMLNIDVQGFELEVLKGSESSLKNIKYIMTEVNRKTNQKDFDYFGCVDISQVIYFLNKNGFNLVECSWDGVSWGDAFFIKQ